MKIAKPLKEEYPEYYDRYISKTETDDPVKALEQQSKKFIKMISKLSKKQLSYRYAEGKWTIKQILGHITDSERVFCYRALTFARKDPTELPGFDENIWSSSSNADERKIKSILREYEAVRKSTISLFDSMTEDMLNQTGIANENKFIVRSFPYIILGHETHHIGVIKERYLSKKVQKEKTSDQVSA